MPHPSYDNEDIFLNDMEQRLSTLKNKSTNPTTGSSSSPTPPTSTSPIPATPFVKRPTLPRDSFFVQLKGFSLIGDVAYFTMIDEAWWSLFAFVMHYIRREFDEGRLAPLKESDVVTSKHVVVADGMKPSQLKRCVIMGFERDADETVFVDVRDVDEAQDMKVPLDWIFEMPEEGLSVPFKALKVQIDKTQLLSGTDTVCQAFQEAQLSPSAVFRAIQVKDRCASLKKDMFTLQLFTPFKENLGDILIKNLATVCSVPVPQPNSTISVTISHFTESGEIFYQACLHQEKLLSIMAEFDVLIRQELPTIRKLNPDYSNEVEVRMRIQEEGTVFAALYPEDGKYYRAELIGFGGDGDDSAHVHFIDYGNDDDVKISEILLLDLFEDALSHIPRLCRRANLVNMNYLNTARMDEILQDYVDFKIKVVSTTPQTLAELFVVEDNVLKRIEDVLGAGNWN